MSSTPSVTVHYTQAILQAAERLALPLPAELRALVEAKRERLVEAAVEHDDAALAAWLAGVASSQRVSSQSERRGRELAMIVQ